MLILISPPIVAICRFFGDIKTSTFLGDIDMSANNIKLKAFQSIELGALNIDMKALGAITRTATSDSTKAGAISHGL